MEASKSTDLHNSLASLMDSQIPSSDRKRKADDFDASELQDTKKHQADQSAAEETGLTDDQINEPLLSDALQKDNQEPAVEASTAVENEALETANETDAPENSANDTAQEESQADNQDANAAKNDAPSEAEETADQQEPTTMHDEQEAPRLEQADPSTAASMTSLSPMDTLVSCDYLVVLNVSATCDENVLNPGSLQVTKENSEIIELAFVVLDAKKMTIVHTERVYVKPERTPLTDYCTQATSITWGDLENAGSLQDAINTLDRYIQAEIEGKHSFCFVTHGGWTLRIQLPREARDKGIELPNYLAFCRMFDLKQEIQRWQVHHPEVSLRSTSLKDLCETFHIDRITDQSAGQNACLTTVRVIRYLTGFRHPDVFVHPIDTNADLQQFKKEESKVVHLAGLPYEVTQGELEAWFSSSGLRPTASWMIQATDFSKPSLSGFVVFHGHNDAMRALALNGRCLGDRAIEVSPSSERVIEAAGSMLSPFPVQAKSRSLRPGDWNCPSCGFHNFASRRNCFKCNTENPNAAAAPPPPPMPSHVPNFTPGDWMCPNYNCNFHNYASRMQCLKCGTYRPPHGSGGPPPGGQPPLPHSGQGYGRPHHNITFRPGDWYCPNPSCNFQNFASRTSCFRCYTNNPSASNPPYPGSQSGYGYSSEQGYANASSSYGHSGYTAPASSGYGYGSHSGPHGGSHGGSNAPFRAGDWYCPSCNSHNFASRFQCLKCSTPKPHNPAPPSYMPHGGGMKRNTRPNDMY